MRILFYPVGGLANRMRAIDSAVNYSESQKSKLIIYWIRDNGLNCGFNAIWKPVLFVLDGKGHILDFFLYLYRRFIGFKYLLKIADKLRLIKVFVDQNTGKNEEIYGYIKLENRKAHYLFLVIVTCENFFPSSEFRNDLFQLLPEVEELVKKETASFDENTIGVHIRRQDNEISIMNSPLELFEDRMHSEIKECPVTKFYIASDDYHVKNKFEDSPLWKDKIMFTKGSLSRDSREGILQAVVELYTLAKTKKIIGSYWSSFSEIAAELGKIPLEVIKKE